MARGKGEVFPSDHRRWFRVYEDILDDAKLNALSGDEFRCYFRLLAMLNRTKCRSGKITFDRYALMACTMRAQVRHSERTLSALGEHGLCSVSKQGEQYVITVPKWAELQVLAPTNPQRTPNEPPATKTKTKTTPKTRERERAHTPKEPSGVCPENLPEPQHAHSISWAFKHGISESELGFRWERVRRWSSVNPSKLRTADGWYSTLRNAAEDRWGADPSKPSDESPAQGRQRRTREAAREAAARFTARKTKLRLAIESGANGNG